MGLWEKCNHIFSWGLQCQRCINCFQGVTLIYNNGRYIILNIQIQGSPFIIIKYHAPDNENDQLLVLNEINQAMDELDVEQNTQIIWGGDFNISFDLQLDTDGRNPKLKVKSITKIMSIMSDHDLCDIYRTRFPSSQCFTWRQKTLLR